MKIFKSNISVAIATFNEKDNIVRCLDAVHDWVDEIIIVDGQSTDGTLS
jgi:glycosyltransferase involved in cell wall biosynthesis